MDILEIIRLAFLKYKLSGRRSMNTFIFTQAKNNKLTDVQIDYILEDLEKKIIRCVGEASERFDEDALRMLRGIRFAGQLQFELEEKTFLAIKEKAPTLVNVSAERIRTELTKLIVSKGSDKLLLAVETGLSTYFLPELEKMLATTQENPHHCFDVGHHSLAAISHINDLGKSG